jgi:hypothetical protein
MLWCTNVVVHNALPREIYDSLQQRRPTPEQILHGRPWQQNSRYDLRAHQLLTLAERREIDPLIGAFVDYHTSPTWWNELVNLFGRSIERLYPDLRGRFNGNGLSTARTGIRFRQQNDVDLECQFGLNTPVTRTSRVRGPHVDDPVELIAGLFYMRLPGDDSKGGELQLYARRKKKIAFSVMAETDNASVSLVKTVPYEQNTFVAFVNHIDSLHGVAPRSPTSYPRLLVNIAVELRRPLFELPFTPVARVRRTIGRAALQSQLIRVFRPSRH